MVTHFPFLVCVCSLMFGLAGIIVGCQCKKTVLICLFLPLPSDPAGAFVASKPDTEQSQANKMIRQKNLACPLHPLPPKKSVFPLHQITQ